MARTRTLLAAAAALLAAAALQPTALGAAIDLCGDYADDVVIAADDEATMSCQVFIKEGASITLEPGATVCALNTGTEDLKPPTLVIERGAKIFAAGTADAPITFTSCDVDDDTRISAAGLWGGLVIVGRAVTAQSSLGTPNNEPEIEGLPGEYYGGDDPEDDSGVLQYVRVWYGGAAVSPDSEINGITFYSVGSGTTVDHIEVAFNLDDGIELFGGSVNMKYVSILFCGDDGIDMDEGYNGNIQFLFVMTGKDGHHGAEIDSQAYQVVDGALVRGPDTLPRTMPRVYNALFVGSVHGTPQSVSSDDQRDALMRIREGAGGEWANLVVANVAKVGLLQVRISPRRALSAAPCALAGLMRESRRRVSEHLRLRGAHARAPVPRRLGLLLVVAEERHQLHLPRVRLRRQLQPGRRLRGPRRDGGGRGPRDHGPAADGGRGPHRDRPEADAGQRALRRL